MFCTPSTGIARIPLASDKGFALVDADTYDEIGHLPWYLATNGYAACKRSKFIYMHHAVIGKPSAGLVVDHINRNRLDSRRANLRIVTQSVNAQNVGAHRDSRSRIRGVSWSRSNNGYIAQFQREGRRVHVGTFPTIEAAAAALASAKGE